MVEAVVVLLALLEPVDDLDELRLHRQRLGLLGVALRVEVRLHLARFAVEEELVGLDALALVRLGHLRPHAGPRIRNLARERELGERGHKGAELEALGHGRDHVADLVRLLADEDARVLVDARRVLWRGHVEANVLARVAHQPALAVGDFDRLARRHERREHRVGLDAARRHLGRAALQIEVLVVDHDAQAPLEQRIQDVAGKRQPLGRQVALKLRLELHLLAAAAEHDAPAKQLAAQDGARGHDRGRRRVQRLERRHLVAVQLKLARAAGGGEADRRANVERGARLGLWRGALAAGADGERVHRAAVRSVRSVGSSFAARVVRYLSVRRLAPSAQCSLVYTIISAPSRSSTNSPEKLTPHIRSTLFGSSSTRPNRQ